ncbi:MAG: Ldh family oxidoreductase [Bacteroidetes bacterium]|nr:Ldh family oxidoreductase [Bacteroidota bacterium]
MKHLDDSRLKKLMQKSLSDRKVTDEAILHVTESLIQTSMRGVDSHGINLFPHYCRAVDAGRVVRNPEIKINKTAESSAVIDAGHAFGHHVGALAIDLAVELASKTGIAAIGVKNSSHFGAAAYFALRAATKGYIGFSFTNADALVKAHSSKDPFFGTNPICFAAPLANESPFCLDMATSLVSWNKINNYRRMNQPIPAHWAFDKEGKPVIDPHLAKSLSPIGEYKGFGLGMMVDVLCAVLFGGLISKDLLAMYTSPIEAQRKIGHFFMAINISKFNSLDAFTRDLQSMVDRIRSLRKSDESQELMVAGDPEKNCVKEREVSGIPMDEIKFEEFLSLSPDFKTALK